MPRFSSSIPRRARLVRTLIASLAVILACSAPVWAQGGASVGGVVEDDSGGALPGATITVTNTSTGAA